MGSKITPESVYSCIIFFMYQGLNPSVKIEYKPELMSFVKKLLNLNNCEVEPFNEYETDRIRFLFKINKKNILKKYLLQGIDIREVSPDYVEYSNRLHKYINNENTRVN